MPAILKIDSVSVDGYVKLTADSAGAPYAYLTIPKDKIYFRSTAVATGSICLLSDLTGLGKIASTDSTTIDHDGNALATSADVENYLSTWR